MARTKSFKPKPPRPLAVLTEEDRLEYALRHNLILQKQVEYDSLVKAQDAFRDSLVEKYGLPQKFDLNLNTGECVLRPPEEDEDAQNGRV